MELSNDEKGLHLGQNTIFPGSNLDFHYSAKQHISCVTWAVSLEMLDKLHIKNKTNLYFSSLRLLGQFSTATDVNSFISNVSYISLLHTALVENRPASHWPPTHFWRQPFEWSHYNDDKKIDYRLGRGQQSRIMSQTAFIYHRFWANFVSLSLPAVRCNASIASVRKWQQPLSTFALSISEIFAVLGAFCISTAWTEQSTSQLSLSGDSQDRKDLASQFGFKCSINNQSSTAHDNPVQMHWLSRIVNHCQQLLQIKHSPAAKKVSLPPNHEPWPLTKFDWKMGPNWPFWNNSRN